MTAVGSNKQTYTFIHSSKIYFTLKCSYEELKEHQFEFNASLTVAFAAQQT